VDGPDGDPPGPVRARGPAARSRALERTRLAWYRTALAAAVVTVLAARLAVREDLPVVVAGAAVACAAVLATAALRTRGRRGAPPRPAGTAPLVAALAVAGYAVLGAVVVALHAG
jgi:uncharacterized membrane protein YidH (DUF202 family)